MPTLISNPPYNMKWKHPFFATSQPRFFVGLPPESNANFAFVLTALDQANRAVFLLPNSVLVPNSSEEKAILHELIDANFLECVITLPDNMFESTSIPTSLLVFNKSKETTNILMIDATCEADQVVRKQRGQSGQNKSRVYKKTLNVFSEETIMKITNLISNPKDVDNIAKVVSLEDVKTNEYSIKPSQYVKKKSEQKSFRDLQDITNDLNMIIDRKNAIKFTVNENMAKSLGVYDLALIFKQSKETNAEMNKALSDVGLKINKEDILSLSRCKELKIEVKDFDNLPEFISIFFNMWKQYAMMMNNSENRLLMELRDALLPKLIEGDLDV